jgi:hypothetical protein
MERQGKIHIKVKENARILLQNQQQFQASGS